MKQLGIVLLTVLLVLVFHPFAHGDKFGDEMEAYWFVFKQSLPVEENGITIVDVEADGETRMLLFKMVVTGDGSFNADMFKKYKEILPQIMGNTICKEPDVLTLLQVYRVQARYVYYAPDGEFIASVTVNERICKELKSY